MCSFGALDKLGPQDKLGHYSHGGEIQYRPHIRHIEPNLTEYVIVFRLLYEHQQS